VGLRSHKLFAREPGLENIGIADIVRVSLGPPSKKFLLVDDEIARFPGRFLTSGEHNAGEKATPRRRTWLVLGFPIISLLRVFLVDL
jgi:hypothetical protein